MQERKNRPKAISGNAKKLITQYSLQDVNQPREIVANILRREIRQSGERPPTQETLKRAISKARNQPESPLDKPWHLGLLTKIRDHLEYQISPETIPLLLEVLEKQKMFTRHRGITIRQALWISRLQKVVIDKDDLWEIAWHYAFNERISEISGTEFNTSNYDNLLFKPKALLEYFRESRQGISYEKYKAVFGQVTNGIEYMGPAMPIDHLLIRDNKVYGRFMVQGKPCQLEMPYPDPNELLEALKKQKIIKSIKKLENGVTVIRLKETVNLLFEKQEYNEALHNLIMGVKNERSHNATE